MWSNCLYFCCALDAANGLIEGGEERRAILRRERARSSGDFTAGPQVCHQIADRQCHSDGIFREGLPIRRNDLRTGFDAAVRQWNVSCDDDIAFLSTFRNPVVGGIHARTSSNALDQRIVRHADEIARDDTDRQPVPLGDAINLVFHRAGVGIDINPDCARQGWFVRGHCRCW